ncbi:MAG: hypothetical protein Q4D79_00320 [Propionibacteriaceae bacterium]|nr:hypothetical protein [Propionibacteriaceae bacterium]
MRKTLITIVIVAVLLGAVGFGAWKGYEWLEAKLTPEHCYLNVDGDDEPLSLTFEQAENASIIVAESYRQGLSEQAAVIALATAWQESSLRNLDYGDRDSLGLFQQRPSYGWGTEAEIMDPWYSSGRFYQELVKFQGWETSDVNDIAQEVQRSGHPEAYRKHESNARALAGALRGSRPGTLACVNREPAATSHATLDQVVAAVPGLTAETGDNGLTLRADDPTVLWSGVQLAMANTAEAGIVRASVGDRQWTKGNRDWQQADEPGQEGVATIEFAS